MSAIGERRQTGEQRGFVLLVVLSTLGVLAVVTVAFTQLARTNVRIAAAAGDSARAEALADAGVNVAVLDLFAARAKAPASRRFPPDASPVTCSMGDHGSVTISVQDEAGKVDLNLASESLLHALVLGVGGREAAVEAILDYRDEDDRRRPSGAERAEYAAAGRMRGPRNGPFLAVEELASVLGVTQADVDRLSPLVTIHSGLLGVDTSVAPREVVAAILRGVAQSGPGMLGDEPARDLQQEKGAPLPYRFLAASTQRTFTVRSEARIVNGATFVREAVIEFLSSSSSAFLVRRWRRGAASGGAPGTGAASPC
jgi:general secretion pathway protein K